jgi:hypothetical protein
MMPLGSLIPRAILAIGLVACESPLSTSERLRLAEGEAKWAARGYRDYSIEMRRSCFCPPEVNAWSRVEVVDGTVVRVTLIETGEIITDSRRTHWSTVELLFADLREIDTEDWLEDIEFTLDPVLGYPTEIRWIASDNVLDAGAIQFLRNPAPLP